VTGFTLTYTSDEKCTEGGEEKNFEVVVTAKCNPEMDGTPNKPKKYTPGDATECSLKINYEGNDVCPKSIGEI